MDNGDGDGDCASKEKLSQVPESCRLIHLSHSLIPLFYAGLYTTVNAVENLRDFRFETYCVPVEVV